MYADYIFTERPQPVLPCFPGTVEPLVIRMCESAFAVITVPAVSVDSAVCAACAHGDHEMPLGDSHCTCPCHCSRVQS
jgi:hypothetical protein